MFPQTRQKCTPSRTRASADWRRSTSSGSTLSRWKAMRCALFGPMPGSRANSSMRSCRGPSNNFGAPALEAQAGGAVAERAEALRQRAYLLLGELLHLLGGVAERAEDEVLQPVDVLRVDDLRVQRDVDDL